LLWTYTEQADRLEAAYDRACRCPIIESLSLLPEKSPIGRQFTDKNPLRPATARAGRIFTGKMSAGKDLSWERSYNGETFYEAGDILIKGRHIKFVIIFPRTEFSWGSHFNVTPATISHLAFQIATAAQ